MVNRLRISDALFHPPPQGIIYISDVGFSALGYTDQAVFTIIIKGHISHGASITRGIDCQHIGVYALQFNKTAGSGIVAVGSGSGRFNLFDPVSRKIVVVLDGAVNTRGLDEPFPVFELKRAVL